MNRLQPEINKIYSLDPNNPFNECYAQVLDIKNEYVKYRITKSDFHSSLDVDTFIKLYMKNELEQLKLEEQRNEKEITESRSLLDRIIHFLFY